MTKTEQMRLVRLRSKLLQMAASSSRGVVRPVAISASRERRFHCISVAGATEHRILGKRGMSKLPANQKFQQHVKRWKRYEKPQPGHRLQMDVKFLERIPGTRKRLY